MKRIDKSNKKRKSRNMKLCFELRERREGYMVKVNPILIGCLGGGMKNLKQICKRFLSTKTKRILYNERNAKDCALGKRIHD